MCLQGCKRLDFIHEFESALFVSSLFNNMSRMQHYVTLLCEEGEVQCSEYTLSTTGESPIM